MHIRLRKARHRSRVICSPGVSSCRLTVVVVLISYHTVADVIFSCAYSPDEVIHILHTVTPPAERFRVTSRKGTV